MQQHTEYGNSTSTGTVSVNRTVSAETSGTDMDWQYSYVYFQPDSRMTHLSDVIQQVHMDVADCYISSYEFYAYSTRSITIAMEVRIEPIIKDSQGEKKYIGRGTTSRTSYISEGTTDTSSISPRTLSYSLRTEELSLSDWLSGNVGYEIGTRIVQSGGSYTAGIRAEVRNLRIHWEIPVEYLYLANDPIIGRPLAAISAPSNMVAAMWSTVAGTSYIQVGAGGVLNTASYDSAHFSWGAGTNQTSGVLKCLRSGTYKVCCFGSGTYNSGNVYLRYTFHHLDQNGTDNTPISRTNIGQAAGSALSSTFTLAVSEGDELWARISVASGSRTVDGGYFIMEDDT